MFLFLIRYFLLLELACTIKKVCLLIAPRNWDSLICYWMFLTWLGTLRFFFKKLTDFLFFLSFVSISFPSSMWSSKQNQRRYTKTAQIIVREHEKIRSKTNKWEQKEGLPASKTLRRRHGLVR